MKQATITLDNLTIGYLNQGNKIEVVSSISNKIYPGELICLLGANGVGKSTLLRTIAGFQPSLAGEIKLFNKRLNQYSAKEIAKHISIVLTQRPDIYNMRAYELVSIGRSPYTGFWGSLSDEDKIIIDQAFEDVAISELKERFIHTLSDGERQKVMITKALVQDTPIILLDEPTAFLDFASKVEITQLLLNLARERKKSILLTTHDMELAFQVADQIWLFNRNNQLESGTPEDLALSNTFNRFFENSGVSFNIEEALFKLNRTIDKEVQLIGNGNTNTLIEKSLLRNGIGISSETNLTKITVINEKPFTLKVEFANSNCPTQKVNSIKELLEYKSYF